MSLPLFAFWVLGVAWGGAAIAIGIDEREWFLCALGLSCVADAGYELWRRRDR